MAKKMSDKKIKSLSEDLVKSLNSSFKGTTNAAHMLSDSSLNAEVNLWHHTGSDILDLAISNRPDGGWPAGRIIELAGLPGTGKSLLAAYALASTQKAGGVAVLIDTEHAASPRYMETIGVDLDSLVYSQMEALEDIFQVIDKVITKVRTSGDKIPITIVVDSVMGATTYAEKDSEYEKDGYATQKAIILSKAMRKITNRIGRENVCLIFTNQLRIKMGVTFGDPWTTSGGQAIGFHSSVRVRLKKKGTIKLVDEVTGEKVAMGVKTIAKIVKNRLGPPLREVEFDIYFKSGIDNYGSWKELLKKKKLMKSGAWNKLKNIPEEFDSLVNPETGEQIEIKDGIWNFRKDDFAPVLEANPEFRKYLYELICDNYIMEYELNRDFTSDDVELESVEDELEKELADVKNSKKND